MSNIRETERMIVRESQCLLLKCVKKTIIINIKIDCKMIFIHEKRELDYNLQIQIYL